MRRGQRSFARDLGWTDVIVEGDCSQGLSAIQNRVEDLKLSYIFLALLIILLLPLLSGRVIHSHMLLLTFPLIIWMFWKSLLFRPICLR